MEFVSKDHPILWILKVVYLLFKFSFIWLVKGLDFRFVATLIVEHLDIDLGRILPAVF